jgi:hypothetical protein
MGHEAHAYPDAAIVKPARAEADPLHRTRRPIDASRPAGCRPGLATRIVQWLMEPGQRGRNFTSVRNFNTKGAS